MVNGLVADYDVFNTSGLVVDGSNRVQLVSDSSGNSAENVLVLNGVAGNYASANKIIPTGSWRAEASVSLVNYSSGATQGIVNVFNSAATSNRSWSFAINTTGNLQMNLSSLGDSGSDQVIISSVALSTTNLTRTYVAADVNLASGTIDFEVSTDGVTWSALGVQQSFTPISLFNSNASLAIGAVNVGTGALLNGNVHYVRLYQTGALVFDADFTAAAKLATSFTESSVNAATVTINTTGQYGARICGARDLVNMTAANQPIRLPWSGTNYGYVGNVAANTFSCPLANDTYDLAITYLDDTTDTDTIVVSNGQAAMGGTAAKLNAKGLKQVVVSKSGVTRIIFDPSRYVSGAQLDANTPMVQLSSDGATANRRGEATPGAPGAIAGMAASFPFEFDVPTSNPAANGSIAVFCASFSDTNTNGFRIVLGSDGSLGIYQTAADFNNRRQLLYAGFRAAYSSQRVRGVVVFDTPNTTTNPKIYVGGVDITASFTGTTAGTPPNWIPTTLDTTKFLSGFAFPANTFVPHAPILGALTAAEVLEWTQTGRLPDWCELGTGSAVNLNPVATGISLGAADADAAGLNNLFNATLTQQSGARTAGAGAWVQRLTEDGAFPSGNRVVTAGSAGIKLGINLWARRSGVIDRLQVRLTLVSSGGVAKSNTLTFTLTDGWQLFEGVLTATAAYDRLTIGRLGSVGTSPGSGDWIEMDDLGIYPLGPIAKWVCTAGSATGIDYGASGINLTLTSGITAVAATAVTMQYPWLRWRLNGGSVIVNNSMLYFDGANDSLKAAAFAYAQPCTVYFLGSQVTWTEFEPVIDGNSVNTLRCYQRGATPRLDINAGSALTGVSVPLSTRSVLCMVFDGVNSSIQNDFNAPSVGNAGTASANGFILGTGASGAGPSNITFTRALLYSGAHNKATQRRTIRYLMGQGGVS
jgi:hypothetical protein